MTLHNVPNEKKANRRRYVYVTVIRSVIHRTITGFCFLSLNLKSSRPEGKVTGKVISDKQEKVTELSFGVTVRDRLTQKESHISVLT